MDEQTPGNVPPQDQAAQQPAPPPYQPPQRPSSAPAGQPSVARRSWWIPISCAVGCLPWFLLLMVALGALVAAGTGEGVGKHVALIRVTGVITGGGDSVDIFGGSTAGSEDIVKQLERARKSKNVKAIVVRIISPGGSAAGSEEVYNEIMRIREEGKPIYASMGDVAASGAYWIASACDRIYADSSTITGSIGVIFSMADLSELYRKIGYKPEVVKSGKFKDMGSGARPLTPEERKLLQALIDDVYSSFLNGVAKGRGRKAAEIKPIADGRIFTGSQALKLKLIDSIGGLHETVRAAARAGGIVGEPKVVTYERRSLLDVLFGVSDASSSSIRDAEMRRLAAELLRRSESIKEIK